ncbi:hypothetical protein EYF80_015330 [Liparis tanakae]|uniref:Uncharacterized protein n=1 Tax=Liparis tanakae TaxID=230148 RepID=A0A4Z2I9J8_9TELE|nr:hypothetical protein EYF80_015330 [Liparis tanakae]
MPHEWKYTAERDARDDWEATQGGTSLHHSSCPVQSSQPSIRFTTLQGDCFVFFVTKLASVTKCVYLFPSVLSLLEL